MKGDKRTMEKRETHILDFARVIQVIEVKYCAGNGTPDDKYREVIAYFDFNGNCIGIKDPTSSEFVRLP